MNAVLFWKEYRQQRVLWLAILVLAVLLGESLIAVYGLGPEERLMPGVAMLCLALTYGVISGALLLATEKEEGTLAFLDMLTGQRTKLWESKVLAGMVLTVLQGLALAGLSVGLGFCSWEMAAWMPLAGLDALAWGLLGGALCSSGLAAVLVGVLLMAGGWALGIVSPNSLTLILIEGGLAAVGTMASWRIFCGDDLTRRVRRQVTWRLPRLAFLAPGYVLAWLVLRQGRWVLALGTATALLLGFVLNFEPLVLWPIGTLALGVACGLAVFLPDQQGGAVLLGTQRLPSGRVWLWKTGFWAAALFALLALAWYFATGVVWLVSFPRFPGMNDAEAFAHFGQFDFWIDRWFLRSNSDVNRPSVLLLALWPVYGFCAGQFFGQVARRSLHAVFLAVVLAGPLAGLWAPSLLIGGVPFWQPLVLAGLLPVASLLAMRPWISGRLWTIRPLLTIGGVLALMAAGLAASLWYRAVQVPDLGEPFDVKAFVAGYPPPEHNEAGRLLRHAAESLDAQRQEVDTKLGPPTQPLFPPEPEAANSLPLSNTCYTECLVEIVQRGWPAQDTEVARWLDQLFEGEWAAEARQVAKLPLGVVQDPRLVGSPRKFYELANQLQDMGRLFVVRALQRQAHGDARGGLHDLETVLRLARQVQNRAPMHLCLLGEQMEAEAVRGFRHWLQKAGSDRALLREALAIVRKHAASTPDLTDTVKAEFVLEREEEQARVVTPTIRNRLLRSAHEVPWERERQVRVRHALWAGTLRQVQQPGDVLLSRPSWEDHYLYLAAQASLPPPQGPGSALSAEQWGQLVSQELFASWGLGSLFVAQSRNSQRTLRLTELALAICLYQVDHGSAPPRLDALVPDYLKTVPQGTLEGFPFEYRISRGEIIEVFGSGQKIELKSGQAVLVILHGQNEFLPIPPPGKER